MLYADLEKSGDPINKKIKASHRGQSYALYVFIGEGISAKTSARNGM